jgi:hypothetical protein
MEELPSPAGGRNTGRLETTGPWAAAWRKALRGQGRAVFMLRGKILNSF